MGDCEFVASDDGHVLVAHPRGSRADRMRVGLREAGLEVEACDGPFGVSCALLDGEPCPAASGAAVIVLGVVDEERTDELFFALRLRYPSTRLVLMDARERAGESDDSDRVISGGECAAVVDEVCVHTARRG